MFAFAESWAGALNVCPGAKAGGALLIDDTENAEGAAGGQGEVSGGVLGDIAIEGQSDEALSVRLLHDGKANLGVTLGYAWNEIVEAGELGTGLTAWLTGLGWSPGLAPGLGMQITRQSSVCSSRQSSCDDVAPAGAGAGRDGADVAALCSRGSALGRVPRGRADV